MNACSEASVSVAAGSDTWTVSGYVSTDTGSDMIDAETTEGVLGAGAVDFGMAEAKPGGVMGRGSWTSGV